MPVEPKTKHYCDVEVPTVQDNGYEGARKFATIVAVLKQCHNGCDPNCPARKVIDTLDEEDFDRE